MSNDAGLRDIVLPQPFLKPFPLPEVVFVDPVERYARYLNPLISVDLSAVDPSLSGWLHVVSPVEPYDGLLGENTRAHWGKYLQENWIAFRLTVDDRYELLGDFGFFEFENPNNEYLKEFYDEEHASFEAHKAVYLERGEVCRVGGFLGNRVVPVSALTHLGGRAPAMNLFYSSVPGAVFSFSDDDGAPRTSDGRLYRFIAAVPGWHYRKSGADDILLYYDPVERVALQTFVFT